ncbi:MAG: BrnA antitoxin family protein [Aestuariivirga sp.]
MDRSSRRPKPLHLDDEERKLEDALERGEYEEVMSREEAQADWNAVLANSRRKVPITVRLSDEVIDKLKVKAIQEGMPYQTLLSSVLHKYVTGRLVERD